MQGAECLVDSRVKAVQVLITIPESSPPTAAEVRRLIEKALLVQARIVVTRLDAKRVSVTFNDALPTPR